MTCFGKFTLFFIQLLCLPATKSELYSNKFLMKAEVTTDQAKLIAEKYGFIFRKQVIPGYFVLKRVDVTDKTTSRSKWKSNTMRKEYPQIKSIKQERYSETTAHTVETEHKTSTEFSVTDPYWKNMWHLHPEREPNMGVYRAWSRGYTGKGVTLAIIDSGIDQSQTDLQRNYVAELAYDYLDDDDNPLTKYTAGESSHGTQCAGIAVAEKNNSQCIAGIAHEAKFTNLRTFGETTSATNSDIALAFTHHMDDIAIYSNSWGIIDGGQGFTEPQSIITDAFKVGVYKGRRGKGVIYTSSSGNGGAFLDCNLDIYNSNIYTISVNSVAFDGSPADYAETCTAVMISAFGGSFNSGARITTTDSNNDCTTTFSGTSAACPMVIPGYFVLKRVDVTDKTTSRSKWKSNTMRKDFPQIKSIKQESYPETTAHTVETEPKTSTEFSVTDPYWKNMWHLHPDRVPNMGVYKAWSRGYTGKGVTLAFIDTGIDQTQTDLQRNYVAELAYDYLDDDDNPLMNYIADESSHGTQCAGIAVAEKNNNQCIVGIAHEARFTNLRNHDESISATYSDVALAFTHHTDDIAIYSNSWGITDRGQGFPESQSIITDAFKVGVCNGRRGKGVIYTFSSGNGGVFQDCNLDIYSSNIYTISVNSVAFDGSPADYAETCTAVMISAFGGSFDSGARITTTDSNNDCTTTFSGTSAACPMVSGIIALTLQANPELTWRDIQHLIVETATTSGLKNGAFVTNGSGRNVSLFFGFGLISADTMISRALSWKTVPPLHRHTSAIKHVNRASYIYNIQSSKLIRSNITYIEQVLVWMKFRTSIFRSVSFSLASPSGTENRILRRRVFDSYKNTTWTSLSVHCWGENPNGDWKLTMSSTGTAYLYEWRLYIYGTLTDPLLDNPKDVSNGYIGSQCYGTSLLYGDYGGRCLLNGACIDDDIACNTVLETCVKCSSNFHKIDNQCMKDGVVGGKCLSNSSCIDDDALCDSSNNTCVFCSRYTSAVIDGKCVRDGSLGGFCDYYSTCYARGTYCNSSSNKCECQSGFNESTSSCSMDGFVGGNCLSNSSCFGDNTVCDNSSNTCVSCATYSFTVIDGRCVEDGSLGGFCDYFSTCYARGTYCSSSSNKCECRNGYNESAASCSIDGFVGGNCLSDNSCFGDNTVCDSSNTCVSCPRYSFTVIDGRCVEDGTLGGVCKSYYTSCTPSHSRCNVFTDKCECQSGYIEVNGSCKAGYGYVGGRCSLYYTCFGYNTACDRSRNICAKCPYYHSKINGKCVRDGIAGGKCLHNQRCIESDTVCAKNNNTCMKCPEELRVLEDKCVRVDLNQNGAEVTCDERTNTCVKDTHSYDEVDTSFDGLGSSEEQVIIAIIITAPLIVLVVAVILLYRNSRKPTSQGVTI